VKLKSKSSKFTLKQQHNLALHGGIKQKRLRLYNQQHTHRPL